MTVIANPAQSLQHDSQVFKQVYMRIKSGPEDKEYTSAMIDIVVDKVAGSNGPGIRRDH
jgi:hypothetical protein